MEHCLTYFNHVNLPHTALLASASRDVDDRAAFFDNIHRVVVGTMSIAGLSIASMRVGAYIAGRYSQRRKVIDAYTGASRPIISFTTQQIPILSTIAQVMVFKSFVKRAIALFTDKNIGHDLKHCVASIAKTVCIKHCHGNLIALSDRCGAQGVFEVNQLSVMHVRNSQKRCRLLHLTNHATGRLSRCRYRRG